MELVDLLGMVASIVSLIVWWPQAAAVWRARRDSSQLTGLSMQTQVLLLLAAVLWGGYAVAIGSVWVGAPSLVNAPIAVGTLVVLGRGRRPA
ncbi:hypothetical protein Q6348_07230 [Isoptericola sp. b441]|uniref:PQ-loop repeat-containing protein n=1 Tax=Actinotalea lenta TaxID=3064654 RepID=A0ABT9D9Q0_9CELL|nr:MULTISPECIES: hypothetical protein [unclassified Isoptericola]MDO8106989.1 hypothetical protein [Isoptericola sp. b441]MDO8121301.1 hypothetical protein [Isoptericola sp. b490]